MGSEEASNRKLQNAFKVFFTWDRRDETDLLGVTLAGKAISFLVQLCARL
jgi:hypothetical protein